MPTDLVTGATGLLGANLVRGLRAAGRDVRILVRATSQLRSLAGVEGLARAQGDLSDVEALARAAEGVDVVYHCAALVSMDPRRATEMRRANVAGTDNLLAAVRKAGVRRLVHVSSVDGIGLPEDGTPSDEATPWNWDRLGLDNPYARTKYESQQRVLTAAAADVDAVVVNPSYMFGAYDQRPSSGQMILEVAAGKAVGYTPGGNNFVDVEDVVAGMLAAAERGRRGELYILGGVDRTYREVMAEIAELVGRPPPRLRIPRVAALVGGAAAGLASRLAGREQTLNLLTARLGFVDHYYSPAKAIRELGLPQSPLRGALERAIAWFRGEGML